MAPTQHADPVAAGLADSRRRLLHVALFSGLINLLTMSGSLYMLQVYDRVIPSRNLATLTGLSVMVLAAYLLQGYLDALRARMLARIAAMLHWRGCRCRVPIRPSCSNRCAISTLCAVFSPAPGRSRSSTCPGCRCS
jgi:ABC-type protease/lipase transport system fused ATPase/permease subunit